MARLTSTARGYRETGTMSDAAGDLDTDAAAILDGALDAVVASLVPSALQPLRLPPEALVAAQTATALAAQARAATDIPQKLRLAAAASYSAGFFGLPKNNLLYAVDQVCGMYAMTAYQRRAMHEAAAAILESYVLSLKKGSAMSGIFQAGAFRDGSLGLHQNGAYHDGSLGAVRKRGRRGHVGPRGNFVPVSGLGEAYKDGSLGLHQNGAFRDGSLGLHQNGAYHDGSLGRLRRRSVSGLGCGCSGVGDDAVAPAAIATAPTPIYKNPLAIGGAAVVLGVVLYAVTRKK